MARFEVVKDEFRKTEGEITLPTRATAHSVAYDVYSPIDVVIEPHKNAMIWTDVKANFNPDSALLLNVRSSMGKHPVMIANTQGWIESDYYGNESNDGNIGVNLYNLSDNEYVIHHGDRIAQAMLIKYETFDNGNTDTTRTGGFGSTN